MFDAKVTPEGRFVLGGFSSSGSNGNKTTPNYGGNDFWLLRLDANGGKIWEQSLGSTDGDEMYAVQVLSDGGYLLGGSSAGVEGMRISPKYGAFDFWFIRTDSNGNKL